MTTKHSNKLVGCAALLMLLAGAVHAQATVYRCGPDGRSYSEKPCPGGQALAVDDARSPAQRDAGLQAADREARAARELAKDNRERERAVRPAEAISLSGEPKAQASRKTAKTDTKKPDDKARKPKTKKPAKPDDFAAVVPGSEPAKKKRRRSA